jgi:HSP20 family molecular chaperone IbpA
MSLKDKYKPLLDLLDELKVEDLNISVERGTLIINGKTKNQNDKNLIDEKVKQINVEKAFDINIAIDVKN